jgi:hypothetical protein
VSGVKQSVLYDALRLWHRAGPAIDYSIVTNYLGGRINLDSQLGGGRLVNAQESSRCVFCFTLMTMKRPPRQSPVPMNLEGPRFATKYRNMIAPAATYLESIEYERSYELAIDVFIQGLPALNAK